MTAAITRTIRRVCVFCGSSPGVDPVYRDEAARLGRELARRDWELVYGGGSVGLMGEIADAVLAAGGKVTGVIPQMLAVKELQHTGCTTLHVTPTMHVRKQTMADAADAFVAMPGGFGTFEEVLEIATWAQLGMHEKPIALFNVRGFYDPLLAFIDHTVREGFIRENQRAIVFSESDAAALCERLVHHEMPHVKKWVFSSAET